MIRMILAAVIAYLLIPEDLTPRIETGAIEISSEETLSAAQSVLEDVSGFCERNPDACETGNSLFEQIKGSIHSTLDEWSQNRADPGMPASPNPPEAVVEQSEN